MTYETMRSTTMLAILVAHCAATTKFLGQQPPGQSAPAGAAREKTVTLDFDKDDAGKPPKKFTIALTGDGPAPTFVAAAETTLRAASRSWRKRARTTPTTASRSASITI